MPPAVYGIRRRGSQPRDEAVRASLGQRPSNAQHADGPDGSGDGEPDEQASQEHAGVHRLTVGA